MEKNVSVVTDALGLKIYHLRYLEIRESQPRGMFQTRSGHMTL
jgi:hypothetical protein